jgi:hypothetical protein
VPGTYLIGEPVVTIAAFAQQLHVITSKQRPRKLTIHGSDGAEYMFLLKGHEDLRQARGLSAAAALNAAACSTRPDSGTYQRFLVRVCHLSSGGAGGDAGSTLPGVFTWDSPRCLPVVGWISRPFLLFSFLALVHNQEYPCCRTSA